MRHFCVVVAVAMTAFVRGWSSRRQSKSRGSSHDRELGPMVSERATEAEAVVQRRDGARRVRSP